MIDYFYNKFNLDLNYERCIEIAIYHDFGEMDLSKDVDIKENEDKLIKQNKDIYENMKIKQLSEKYYSKIYDYYNEYKNKKTQKSLLVNACDKLEGMIHPISIGEPIMNHELFATYADNAIKSYPILMPIYKQVKNRLKNSYEKWGFEWKKEYDNIFEEC